MLPVAEDTVVAEDFLLGELLLVVVEDVLCFLNLLTSGFFIGS